MMRKRTAVAYESSQGTPTTCSYSIRSQPADPLDISKYQTPKDFRLDGTDWPDRRSPRRSRFPADKPETISRPPHLGNFLSRHCPHDREVEKWSELRCRGLGRTRGEESHTKRFSGVSESLGLAEIAMPSVSSSRTMHPKAETRPRGERKALSIHTATNTVFFGARSALPYARREGVRIVDASKRTAMCDLSKSSARSLKRATTNRDGLKDPRQLPNTQ